jgi:enamine deaminase RidA (YjgF/YER057c/UK114 family)
MGKRVIHRSDSYIITETMIGGHQAYLTASVTDQAADPAEVCGNIYQEVVEILAHDNMKIVHDRLFGSLALKDEVTAAREAVLSDFPSHQQLPFTYIEGKPIWGEGFAGIQLRAIDPVKTGDEVWTIFHREVPVGRGWRKNGNTYLMVQNLHGIPVDGDNSEDRSAQAGRMFTRAEALLMEQGATYQNVVRTWIYLDDILDWYDEFNVARNEKYREFQLIPAAKTDSVAEKIYLPASTGIMGNNPQGAAAVMDMLAIIPSSTNNIMIKHETGLRQNSPFRYGSAFSRATRIEEIDITHIMLSGTAAIDEAGKSLYPGDPRRQIQKTLEVIAALIEKGGAAMTDICEATVFLKHPQDVIVYQEVMEEWGLDTIPSVIVVADICREELLFELDAVVALSNKNLVEK